MPANKRHGYPRRDLIQFRAAGLVEALERRRAPGESLGTVVRRDLAGYYELLDSAARNLEMGHAPQTPILRAHAAANVDNLIVEGREEAPLYIPANLSQAEQHAWIDRCWQEAVRQLRAAADATRAARSDGPVSRAPVAFVPLDSG